MSEFLSLISVDVRMFEKGLCARVHASTHVGHKKRVEAVEINPLFLRGDHVFLPSGANSSFRNLLFSPRQTMLRNHFSQDSSAGSTLSPSATTCSLRRMRGSELDLATDIFGNALFLGWNDKKSTSWKATGAAAATTATSWPPLPECARAGGDDGSSKNSLCSPPNNLKTASLIPLRTELLLAKALACLSVCKPVCLRGCPWARLPPRCTPAHSWARRRPARSPARLSSGSLPWTFTGRERESWAPKAARTHAHTHVESLLVCVCVPVCVCVCVCVCV